jgi:hypothetical protein
MNRNKYNKESIKARMYARIASLWGVRSIDELDPVVKLLVESLAAEIFTLSGELDTIGERVVDKLAHAFTPALTTTASPAHAVLHARATGPGARVDVHTEFAYKEPRFIQRHGLRKLSMTPVCEVPAFDADVVSLVAAGRFYNVTARGGKDHVANAVRRDPVFNNTLWIGVETGTTGVNDLNGLTFWFEFPLLDDPDRYVRLLAHGNWSQGERAIATAAGLPEHLEKGDNMFAFHDPQFYLRNEIRDKYNNRFIAVTDPLPAGELKRGRLPNELEGVFDDSFTSTLRDDVVWFRVVLPAAFDDIGLHTTVAHINCFPVANIYRRQSLTTITPLSSITRLDREQNEYFLFVEDIHDSAGHSYKQIRTHADNNEPHTYTIRRGGSERFSSLEARDFLDRLLDIFRNESIAFSGIDRDIAGTAERMMEYLNDFERKLKSYDGNIEHSAYLILGGDIRERTGLTVRYAVTNGEIANGIRTGEPFSVPEVSDFYATATSLMTTTRGGQRSPSGSSQKEMYQFMLTSHDRVYTREDIKLFCRSHFGDSFTGVEVENGYENSLSPGEGIVRTTRVVIRGAKVRSEAEQGVLASDILAGLQRRSPDSYNYKIVFEQ